MLLKRDGYHIYRRYIKRAVDILLSFIGLLLLSPLLLLLAIWIKLDSKGPVLFRQKRIGRNKIHFNIMKFRTMRKDAPKDVPTHLLNNPEAYITHCGHFLRRTSLDELPQIWNILMGKMSIIGPRPALWNQEDLVAERDRYGANNVRPGLTGWAQINGRDELEIATKAQRDGEYVQNMTFKMDLTCFLMTVGNVLKSKGVIEGGTGITVEQKRPQAREAVSEK